MAQGKRHLSRRTVHAAPPAHSSFSLGQRWGAWHDGPRSSSRQRPASRAVRAGHSTPSSEKGVSWRAEAPPPHTCEAASGLRGLVTQRPDRVPAPRHPRDFPPHFRRGPREGVPVTEKHPFGHQRPEDHTVTKHRSMGNQIKDAREGGRSGTHQCVLEPDGDKRGARQVLGQGGRRGHLQGDERAGGRQRAALVARCLGNPGKETKNCHPEEGTQRDPGLERAGSLKGLRPGSLWGGGWVSARRCPLLPSRRGWCWSCGSVF